MSGVGLTGVHGSGKTTLAEACVEAFGIEIVKSRVSKVIEGAGYSPAAQYDFQTRLMLQELVLKDATEQYEAHAGVTFITDRTPLDFLTYLMTDILRTNVDEETAARLAAYREECYRVINRHFNVVILVQPGIVPTVREGRGLPNTAYAEHFTALARGLADDSGMKVLRTIIPRHITDLDRRVMSVDESVKMAFKAFDRMAAKKGFTHSSNLVH